MLRPCPSGSKQVLIRSFNDLFSIFLQNKRLQSYKPSKLAVIQIFRPFGFEATFFAILYSESLLFGRPGFDSRQLQTLRDYNFVAFRPGGSKTNFFERFDISLFSYRIDLNATPGFYFSLRIFDPRLPHKKRIEIAFSMNSEGVGFYSRVGLYSSRYGKLNVEVILFELETR